MQFLLAIFFCVFKISHRQKKRVLRFQSLFFRCAKDISKMSIQLALTRIIAAFITSGGASSLMTKLKIAHSIVRSLFPVSEKKSLHSYAHLCALKMSRIRLFVLNMMRIERKSNFITYRMLKMACTDARVRAE